MATSVVMTKSIEIVKDVLDILRHTEGRIAPTILQDYEQRLVSAHNVLNNAAVKMEGQDELTSGARSPSGRLSWTLVVTECMNELSSNVIIPLGKRIKSSGAGEWHQFSNRFHEVHAKVEELSRMIEMIDDPTQQELEQMLWWVSELGTKEHLGWLLQIKHKLPDRLKELEEIADNRVSERVSRQYDADGKLQRFFGLDQREFAHIISNPDWTKKPLTSALEHSPLITLKTIREKLIRLSPEFQIKRWLHTPNSRLNRKLPIEVIKEGRAFKVLHLLSELERAD